MSDERNAGRSIDAEFIVTLRGVEPDAAGGFALVYVLETKCVHPKASERTLFLRSVFDK